MLNNFFDTTNQYSMLQCPECISFHLYFKDKENDNNLTPFNLYFVFFNFKLIFFAACYVEASPIKKMLKNIPDVRIMSHLFQSPLKPNLFSSVAFTHKKTVFQGCSQN